MPDRSVPTREEFLYFSLPEKLLFYALAAVAVGLMVAQIVRRARLWTAGRATHELRPGWRYWTPTPDAARRWAHNVWTYVLLQKGVRASRKRSGAPMHVMLFAGFLAMLVATTLLSVNTYSPVKFHAGTYYLVYELVFDSLGLLLVAGLAWAIVRRVRLAREGQALTRAWLARHPGADPDEAARQATDARRAPLSHGKWDLWALGLLIAISLNGYLLEGARIASHPQAVAAWDGVSWVGAGVSRLLPPGLGPVAYKSLWWFHSLLVLGLFVVIPRIRLRHMILAVGSLAGMPERPMGALRTIPMAEVEETEQVGAKMPADLSRWALLSHDACMECGRCTEVCPAWNVGKILNPKVVVQSARDAMEGGLELAPTIGEEALWQCTTCNACVEACPVGIRQVDLIVDVRRNLVSEGALAGSPATMLRQVQSTGNAWGQRGGREDWMAGLDVPLCRETPDFEYLFWVGCAGSTDPAAMRTSKSVVSLLKRAGVSFACLGDEEGCTGDPARRVGDEFLFQERAEENAGAFEKYRVKKVVTACPHCLNTLRNEYGDFARPDGGELQVEHHTELLARLVQEGRLKEANASQSNVVFHDPCYLSRTNGITEAPYKVAQGMAKPEFHGKKTRCCGAGGGRMWMDEAPDERPANARADQLLEGGATTVAMGCPFCRIMLEPALKDRNEAIRIADVSELMAEANG